MKISNYKATLKTSIICFATSSFSFSLIPFSNFKGSTGEIVRAYMVGALFWSGLLSGMALTLMLGYIRKKSDPKQRGKPGIICFFKNQMAKYCDVIMVAIFTLWLILCLVLGTRHMISMILMSMSAFSIYLHAILNGKNYAFACRKGVRK